MSNALMAKFTVGGQSVELDAATVRNQLVRGNSKVSDQEVAMFINLCKYRQLNPFVNDAYLIKYGDKAPATIVVGKDAIIKRAMEIKECEGWDVGVCCMDKNDNYVERNGSCTLPGDVIIGGWCEVYRKNWRKPFKHTVALSEYHQHNSMWNTKTATMIRKVALNQALREVFPEELRGMYGTEEMGVDDAVLEQSAAAQQPIDAAKKKALAELIGSDMKHIEAARLVLNNHGYNQCKDILNGDYELILADLQAAMTELEQAGSFIDIEPKEPEQMTIEEGEADEGTGQTENPAR